MSPWVWPIAVFVLLLVSVSAVADPRSCANVESPYAPGVPRIIIPPGAIPELGPLEVADLLWKGRSMRRGGFGPARAITCLQYVPPSEGCSANAPTSCGRWLAHVEARFWFSPPASEGGCRASHGLVTVPERAAGPHGAQLLDSRCLPHRSRLTRGR